MVSRDAKSLLGISCCNHTELFLYFLLTKKYSWSQQRGPEVACELCNKENIKINFDTKMTGSVAFLIYFFFNGIVSGKSVHYTGNSARRGSTSSAPSPCAAVVVDAFVLLNDFIVFGTVFSLQGTIHSGIQ